MLGFKWCPRHQLWWLPPFGAPTVGKPETYPLCPRCRDETYEVKR